MHEILNLVGSMSPFLLLGFFLAGLMHAFVPNTFYRKYLGGSSLRSVFNATLLGIPLPLCSCGVIPTAMSLRKDGASRGATVSFLIATPQTGVDSIIATYSILGLPFALLRPLAALVTSLLGGALVNTVDKKDGCSDSNPSSDAASDAASHSANKTFVQKMREAFHYAFVEMMQDIGRWLIVGLIVAGVITVLVPDAWFALVADKPLLTMLLVLLLAIPMYLCATGSIPIAVALMLKGFSPGTALVLLMAGPAVNVASMFVIGRVMGRKTLLLYLSSIIIGAMSFGLAVDHFLPREWFTTPLQHFHHCHEHGSGILETLCSLLLIILLVNAFIRKHRHGHHCHCCEDHACEGHCECTSEAALILKVGGMSCNHCKANVERSILKVEGVERVEVSLSDGLAHVYGSFDRDAVCTAVRALGFDVSEM